MLSLGLPLRAVFVGVFVSVTMNSAALAVEVGSFTGSVTSISGSSSLTNDRDSLGHSLRYSAQAGRLKDVVALLERGADVDASGAFGETALMAAARYNQIQVAKALLDAGASLDLQDANNSTALMKAAMNCSHRVSSQMLKQDLNVNLTDNAGRSALIFASMNGCTFLVNQLVKARGIDVNIKDDFGRTALDYAMTEAQIEVGGPYTDIAIALRKAGGKTSSYVLVPREKPQPQVKPQSLP